MTTYIIIGILLWLALISIIIAIRPGSKLHKATVENHPKKCTIGAAIVLIITILICTLPMSIPPAWNGEWPGHRNQYEIAADSFLDGHLYIDDGNIDERLLNMDNPYNYEARKQLGMDLEPEFWDRAFYKGHLYMYFGVAPVILLFMPYKLITGMPLTSYKATAIFAALCIIGLFLLLKNIAKKYFKDLPYSVYLFSCVGFSLITLWYAVDAPALYCTAITAGICMELFSLYFFTKAVWFTEKENKAMIYAAIGSLFGALAFACRPPIALANLLVLPLLIQYIKTRNLNKKSVFKLILAALPYIIIAALLMIYNFVRFDDPFEFGQKYQLTVSDQSQYSVLSQWRTDYVFKNLGDNFFKWPKYSNEFPYMSQGGIFFLYPVLFFAFIPLIFPTVLKKIKENKLILLVVFLFLLPIIITIIDILWVPYLLTRYQMDVIWIIAILTFLLAGFLISTRKKKSKKILSFVFCFLLLLGMIASALLFFNPYDGNLTRTYPEILQNVYHCLTIGMG